MYDRTIPDRIRKKLEATGMAGYELAERAKISPSYLSLILNGQKLPSVEVAVRLAEALGEDPDLYRGWVETADDPDLEARVSRMQKVQQAQRALAAPKGFLRRRGRSRMRAPKAEPEDLVAAEPAESFQEESGEELRAEALPMLMLRDEDGASRTWQEAAFVHDLRNMPEPGLHPERGAWPVPLLPEGSDPASRARRPRGAGENTITIDASFLEEDQNLEALFAYRVSERTTERVRNLIRPGDVLVFANDPEAVDSAAIYAVRLRSRIVLSRVMYIEPNLLLMDSDPTREPERLEVGDEEGLFATLAGVVVAGLRVWPKPRRAEPKPVTPQLGRTGRLEEGSIVRDCDWKEHYGWRPVQRPEDMDYLEAHPKATVRFRLLRDGKARYVLEMNAEQWQEALGDYFDRPSWRRNGYIVAITKKVQGEYTEEFQDRWANHVRKPRGQET